MGKHFCSQKFSIRLYSSSGTFKFLLVFVFTANLLMLLIGTSVKNNKQKAETSEHRDERNKEQQQQGLTTTIKFASSIKNKSTFV